MPIPIQSTTYSTGAGADNPTHAQSFSTLPTVGRHVLVVGTHSENYAFVAATSYTVSDNQGNSYTTAYATGQDVGCFIAWAPITASSGTFTVNVGLAPSSAGGVLSLRCYEVSGLASSSLVDLAVTLDSQASYSTTFDVTTSSTDTAEEFVLAVLASANLQPLNNATTPTNYTDVFEVLSGDGVGYACYRITSATGAQAIDFSDIPQNGAPSMLVRSFRAASGSSIDVSAADSVSASDSATGVVVRAAAASDAASASDSASTQLTAPATASDAVAVSDSAAGIATFPCAAADAVSAADTAASSTTTPASASEAASATDVAAAVLAQASSASDAATTADGAASVAAVASSAADTATATDISLSQGVFQRSGTDVATTTDSSSALRTSSAAAADAVEAADASTTQAVQQVSVMDALSLADIATAGRVAAVAAVEAGLNLLDAALAILLGRVPQVDASRLRARIRVLRERLRSTDRPLSARMHAGEMGCRARVQTLEE